MMIKIEIQNNHRRSEFTPPTLYKVIMIFGCLVPLPLSWIQV